MDLFILTSTKDRSAAAITSASDVTPLVGPADFPELVLGTTEPLTVKFLTGASAYETWSDDPTYTVTASVGYLSADGLAVFAEGALSTVVSDGKSGSLSLNTVALADALRFALTGRQSKVGMTLQIAVTDASGDRRVYAQLPVFVNGRVSTFTPQSTALASETFLTASEIAAAYIASGESLSDIPSSAATEPDFCVVVIPDSQLLTFSDGNAATLNAQIQWAVDNKTAENVKAVVGVGDIAETPNSAQMGRGVTAYNLAKAAGIPVVPAIGNHDYDSGDPASRATTLYDANFGPSYFSGQSWYGASTYPVSSSANFYVTFTNGGTTYLVLALEFFPRAAAVAWAQGVIAANPNAYIIITTHAYLKPDGRRVRDVVDGYGPTGLTQAGDYDGEEIYDALVAPYSNVRLVVSGHFMTGANAAHSSAVSPTTGAITHQLFTDYQEEAVADHYMLILRFKPSSGVIQASYYSPSSGQTDPDNASFELPFQPLRVVDSMVATTDGFFGRDLAVGERLFLGKSQLSLQGHKFAMTGAYAFTGTLTNNTAITFPTSGTLATKQGTTTNDSAAAGEVGEEIISTVPLGSAVSLTSETDTSVTTISLTAGDWEVMGVVYYLHGETTVGVYYASACHLGVGLPASLVATLVGNHNSPFLQASTVIPARRVSLASTTTYYLIAKSSFTTSTMAAFGTIRARRVR